ncbi:uncharacterized protein GIQ15_04043 [Arthroderma uncinatum]|uniref:uncharacterized protein n=1 Tax=Arthroderma uncinatum TaxID=74035 RepID=UPI00144AE3F4|nr:uncharacterized protein GIQ15_04043 [Arthroderma uncinatum]KAF3481284.1 hypothetical protein GIQ15_04043 [Arthroderma uncinatum]
MALYITKTSPKLCYLVKTILAKNKAGNRVLAFFRSPRTLWLATAFLNLLEFKVATINAGQDFDKREEIAAHSREYKNLNYLTGYYSNHYCGFSAGSKSANLNQAQAARLLTQLIIWLAV